MTLMSMCEDIAGELQARGLTIRNKVTGREVHSADDVFNFDSHGELSHIADWWLGLGCGTLDDTGHFVARAQGQP